MNVTYELVRLNGGYLYYYPFVHHYEIGLTRKQTLRIFYECP